MRSLLACAVLGGMFAGCGGCGGGSIAIDQMPAETSGAICTKVYECCTAQEIPSGSSFGPDQATCMTTLEGNLDGRVFAIKAEEGRGRLTYHGDRLAECLDRWRTSTCQALKSTSTSTFPPCEDYVQPKVAAGMNCRIDESCIGGRCRGQTLEADGVCAAFVAEGESCASAPCGVGLYCDTANFCRRSKGDGAACNSNGECGSGGCNNRPDGGGAGTCGPKGGTGTTCFVTTGCSVGVGPLAVAAAALVLVALWRRRAVPSSLR